MSGTVEEIKTRLTVEEVFSHFGVDVPPRGRDPVMIRCPWHEDRTPSLAVYRREGRAWCYGCGKGGDVLDVTALFLQADLKEAISYWAARLGLDRDRLSREEKARLEEETRERQLRRRCREMARRASLEAERGLPRPRVPEDLAVYDNIYALKDRLDEGLPWVEDMSALRFFVQGLASWRSWAFCTLLGDKGWKS